MLCRLLMLLLPALVLLRPLQWLLLILGLLGALLLLVPLFRLHLFWWLLGASLLLPLFRLRLL